MEAADLLPDTGICITEGCIAKRQSQRTGLCKMCRQRNLDAENREKRLAKVRHEEVMKAQGKFLSVPNLTEVMKKYGMEVGTLMIATGRREWDVLGWMSGEPMSPDDAKLVIREVQKRQNARKQRVRKAGIPV